jgi:hypothetical protein
MAVLAFENNGHYGWNSSDTDHTIVQNGLNWLFSTASTTPISGANSAGNPDVSGDGYGIFWAGDSGDCVQGGTSEPDACVYETPMVLMAIVASNAKTNVTTTGPTGVVGRTYIAVAQDIVDWIAWAQNSKPGCCGVYEGGWRYDPQTPDGSDNSVSQWPVVGLLAAQLWGVNAPSWVATELQKWIKADQDLSGTPATNPYYGAFDYLPGEELYSPAESAAGIAELTYVGASKTNSSILAAEGYLYSDWTPSGGSPCCSDWNWNIGDLYDMYAVMKAERLTTPTPSNVTNYAGNAIINWYNGVGQYADSLLANQGGDGHWNNWVPVSEGDDVSNYLGTAWGVLILEYVASVRVTYTLSANVADANTLLPIPGVTVTAVGPTSQSGTTGANGWVTFDNVQGGTYNVAASKSCYLPTRLSSQIIDLDRSIVVNMTLTQNPDCVRPTPEFGASSVMTMIIAALGAAVVILVRPKKLQARTKTR